ncbi:MAG: hypothetical protein J6X18_00525 [Bacteroidales bacterium]|nr:hypothetical protein [Bacteroidales bacterium]
MSREEEIKQSAKNRADQYEHPVDWNNCYHHYIQGAEWADQNPSVDTVKKIVCYALKRTNIMLAEDLENGVEWELLIKKAMKD